MGGGVRVDVARVALLLGLLSAASPARATYSIAGVDESTGEVGGAGASCVGSSGVARIYGSAPGIAVVLAQADSSPELRDEAARRLMLGESPSTLLVAITDPAFDRNAAARQYGVVSLSQGPFGFTGSETLGFADDLQGRTGTFAYSVQGNILTGESVLGRSRDAFESDACDLPERLMRALEAGGVDGEGDRRCAPAVPADAAFIQVDRPGEPAGSYLFLEVRNTGSDDPVALLRNRFDAWRATHPCPELPDAGVAMDAGAESDRDSGCAASPGGGFGSLVIALLLWRRASRA